jgi:hypothetical protein
MVLAAMQETIGIVDDATIKSSHGLSGGGGLSAQSTCGALNEGLMALSAKYGRDRNLAVLLARNSKNNSLDVLEIPSRFVHEVHQLAHNGTSCCHIAWRKTASRH